MTTITTIQGVPTGRDRHGNPLPPRIYAVDERREDFRPGVTRVFVHRPDLEVGDGTLRFAPELVRTESITDAPPGARTERITNTTNTPAHLAPDNCYICGKEPHANTAPVGHSFWSNADAAEYFAQERQITHLYPGGQTSPAAAYIAQHRPY